MHTPYRIVFGSCLLIFIFPLFGDTFLAADPEKQTTDTKKEKPKNDPATIPLEKAKAAFQSRDVDQDGRVTEHEFISSFPKERHAAAGRDFLLFNRDGDDVLSFTEYCSIPGLVPQSLRSPISHPLTPLVEQRLSVIENHWKSWDADGNNRLSSEELQNAKINEQIPGLPPVVLKDWDRDADGQVSQEDCRQVLEACYGLRRLDGQPLYLPSGQIVYWWHFKNLDRDHNDQLNLEEYLSYYGRYGEEQAKQKFEAGDSDQNQTISLREWAEMPGLLLDPIAEFQKMDLNLDGYLDRDELFDQTAKWLQSLTGYTFPGFDLDRDGRLSLDEYRMTLPVNKLENWDVTSVDADHDGRLSLEEMAWTSGLELSLLRQEYFQRLDVNQNGFLDFDEFKVSIDSSKAPEEIVLQINFQSRDINRDGRVTVEEFVASFPKEKQPEAKRDFQVFNLDGDDQLSLAEFCTIPGAVPLALRGELPHPLLPLIEKQMAVVESQWPKWDENRDRSLSSEEYTSSELNMQIPGLTALKREDWDRDRDGKISLEDCRRVMEAAYGMRRLDGQPLQLPTGLVVYWWHFKDLDRDHNDQLTLKEFQNYYNRFGEEAAQKRFQQGDSDQNETLSLQEWAQMPGFLLDPIAEFRKMDTSFDGLLDQQELLAGIAPFLKPLAETVFPGFDTDQDGLLSLDEYRLTLLANRIENWMVVARDQDHDGRLSLEELPWTPGLELSLLRKEYLDRLDRNANGYLDLDEFSFSVDMKQAPPDIILELGFKSRDTDKNGSLSEAEYIASFPKDKLTEAKRDFLLFDRDSDENLSIHEYSTIPGMAPPSLRGSLTNPLTILVDRQMENIDKHWKQWDTDQSGTLSQEELQKAGMGRQIPGLARSTWQDWDRNADGTISRDDCRWVLEAGYGLRRLDGLPLHLPTGEIVYWWHFKALDRDHDDNLPLKEFMAYYQRMGEEAGTKRFQEGDTDQNEKITLAEWGQMPGHLLDPIAEFRKMDLNYDAFLDESELLEGTAPFLRPLANYTFPGFDLNQDGMLSLDEYRTSLSANRVENWISYSRDADRDGKLSLAELGWSSGLELKLLRQEYFDRLDINDSGYLEFNEFKYTVDMRYVPKILFFTHCDENQDGSLSLDEFLTTEKNSGKIKLDGSQEPRVLKIEEAFSQADVNGDKLISLAELNSAAGHKIISPVMTIKTGNTSGLQAGDQPNSPGEDSSVTIVVLVMNILLALGVITFLFRSRFKKA